MLARAEGSRAERAAEISSRQAFKDMAKRWLDEDVHADESSTPPSTLSLARNAKRTTEQTLRWRRDHVAPRSRPAPYPSGGAAVPTANPRAPVVPRGQTRPSSGRAAPARRCGSGRRRSPPRSGSGR